MWRRASSRGLTLAALAACAACSTAERTLTPVATVGVASWYGPGFHGRRTSSGEVYDQTAMTAAHPDWPLGTRVRVTNLDNGHVTHVRINDRGPFVGGRAIDLSYAAARELQMLGPGTCNVRLEPLLGDGEPLAAVQFAIQVGAFSDELRAQEYRRRLAAHATAASRRQPAVYIVPAESAAGRVFRVRVGPYAERAAAEASAARLASAGLDAVIVEETASHR